jgi:tripartite-type tricarboxylate transporter receptor subunit TctC
MTVRRHRYRYASSLILGIACLFACGLSMSAAENYPTRPIRLLHGFAAGGAADALARIVSNGLSKRLGQPIVIETKPGAGGNIAAAMVANAEPNGYTLGLVTGGHAISGALYKSLPFSPTDSFEMVSTLVHYAFVIAVRADSPAKTLPDLIAMAKSKPGEIGFGSAGFGSTQHLAGELLNTSAGIKLLHVPYRGDSAAVTALLGGEVPVIFGTTVLLAAQIEGGTVRGLAVTSPARTALLPNVPSAEEAGLKGYDVRTWAGILAPKGTPPEIVAKLNTEIVAVLAEPAVKAALETAIGGEARSSTPDEMRELVRSQIVKWSKVVKDAKIERIER